MADGYGIGNGEQFLRQLSAHDARNDGLTTKGSSSRRWGSRKKAGHSGYGNGGVRAWAAEVAARKRVMVVVDQSSGSKIAMMWALTHVANKGDLLTLLHVLPQCSDGGEDASSLANSLGSLCKACKPEVEVEALVIEGPLLGTILSQVRKLEASVLVLSQPKPSPFCCLVRSSREELVEQCIDRADCLTLAVRRQSKGVGGYLVSTRWQKNFWLLA